MSNEESKGSDAQRYFLEHIAPALAQIAKDCEAKGMSIVALVEYEPTKGGLTAVGAPNRSSSFDLVMTAARSGGSVDGLMFAVMERARKHGHNSLILQQLGIPAIPAAPAAAAEGAVH
ncbi:hypothetical protein [Aquabacter cavernae]|uniref:hypothetical protein n=1 Tax=Aquabacter cavernae TaxID=2496029 RepID=UPI000F8C4E94|nr:hypothetical protein [Aquabacter cavernae]